RRFQEWSAARQTADPNEWSSEQWPEKVREQAEEFAARLRVHSLAPPVIHFVEWVDMWSMGYLFSDWLTPTGGPSPVVDAGRLQVYAYRLPDGGRLAAHLAGAGPHQFQECHWFVARLREAVAAWEELVERAVLVVLREVVD